MKTKFRKKVSLVLALTMLVQLMSIGGIMTTSAASTVQIVDNGADYFSVAKAYGVYTEIAGNADGSDIQQGLSVLPLIPTHQLASVDDEQMLNYIDENLFPKGKATVAADGTMTLGNMKELAFYSKANGIKYVAPNSDGAYDIKSCADADDIGSKAWFTSYNHRVPYTWSVKPVSQNEDGTYNYAKADGTYNLVPNGYRQIPGYIYFQVTDDTITLEDTHLSVIVEYLDNSTGGVGINYVASPGTKSTGGASFTRTNTNRWKTAVWTLDNAGFSSSNTTDLQSTYEMRINAGNNDLYIRKVAIVKTADLTAPDAQKYDVSATRYFKDGVLSHYSEGGNITTEIDITSNTDNDATLYTAVYDANGVLLDVAKSASTPLTANTKTTIKTATAVNVPTNDEYIFRTYIWTKDLTPAYSVNPDDALILGADGFYKLAVLKWDEYENIDNAVKFNVYRDGKLIGATDKTAYYDSYATEGTHTYQIIAVDANGNAVYRSNYAVADVITTIEAGVSFNAARKGSTYDALSNNENVNLEKRGPADIKHNFTPFKVSKLFTAEEALKVWTPEQILASADRANLTQEQMIEKIKNYKYISGGSDGPISTEIVTDDFGVTKQAFYSNTFYRVNTKYYNYSKMYFDITDTTYRGKNNITVFVEYLTEGAGKDSITMYWPNTQSPDADSSGKITGGKVSAKAVSHYIGNNKRQWVTARFDITDAKLGYTYPNCLNGDMYFTAGGGLYISSVFVTDKTGNEARTQYAKYKGSNFGYATQADAEALYPDGVSVSFDSNGQVNNGIRWYGTSRVEADAYSSIETDGNDYYVQQGRAVNNGANKQSYIYFEIDDSYIFGDRVGEGVYLTITYKPDFDGRIYIQAASCDDNTHAVGGNTSILLNNDIKADPDTPWVTETFFINNIAFANSDNGSCDIRITTDNLKSDNALKIKELKVHNLNHKER